MPEADAKCEDILIEKELYAYIKDGIITDLSTSHKKHRLINSITCHNSEIINKHLRDVHIRFEAEGHAYYLKIGSQKEIRFPMSVSNVWACYFEKFDAENVIQKFYYRWCQDPSKTYYELITRMRQHGIPDHIIQNRIKEEWTDAGIIASAQGVKMHRQIELALGGLEFDVSSLEMQYFLEFVNRELVPRGFRVFRTEWAIYDEKVMVAGQVDALFIDASGQFHMVDWKRSKHSLDPMSNAQYRRFGNPPCEHLVDNDYTHYSLQQNLYAAILRRRYNIKVSSMTLVQLHPNYKEYRLISVPMWATLADSLLEQCCKV